MTKKYHRKRYLEENSSDNAVCVKKINFEKSNRQHGKKESQEQLDEYSPESQRMGDLIWEAEMKLANQCFVKNEWRKSMGLEEECTCPLPERLTEEELLIILYNDD
jgi:hypothetical protein